MFKNLYSKFHLVLNYIAGFFLFCLFVLRIRRINRLNILFVDLDNTLFNTWPFLNNKNFNFRDLQIMMGTVDFVSNILNEDTLLVFLSHRPISCYTYSHNVLKKLFANITFDFELYFVPKVFFKWFYFKFGELKYFKTIVIDDLTYNHENGIVLCYQDLIDKINSTSIEYYDYNYIKNLNEKN